MSPLAHRARTFPPYLRLTRENGKPRIKLNRMPQMPAIIVHVR
jgi:hypothetical protein